MLTTLMVSMLTCAPAQWHTQPPPIVVRTTLACEGADQVRRDQSGSEIARWSMAPMCTRVRCESTDWVRRDVEGRELERWVRSPNCPIAEPVRLTRTPGWRFGLSSS